ncbi:hypothetical protein [Ochrobactrum sp. CGA5]|uniref:hypothetical protein n=1 Tax=Ochrobactrum sp. CGA5 TaxID=2583453 RepID=UPI001124145A|nr:hypothetical protein [Ochrobactrum sp. CGA5]
MAWVHFVKDFNYMKPSFTIAYKAGMTLNVKKDCADEAIAKGCAEAVKAPRKGEEPTHGDEGED